MFKMRNIALLLAFGLAVISPVIALQRPVANNSSLGSATQVKSNLKSSEDLSGGFEAVRFGGNGFKHLITPDLSALIQQTIQDAQTPGLSLGVVHFNSSSKEIGTEFGTWGVRNEDGDEMTQDTLFDIGSCSKAFLAAAMGILIDDFSNGRNVTPLPPTLESFSWKTKVQELFPGEDSGWLLEDEWANKKANLLDILTHVSGLPRHDLSYGPADSPSDLVKRLRYLKPQFELREQWSYNNQMYILGSHIISTYSGKPFTTFVKERIFIPLRMTSTTYSPEEAAQSGNFSQPFTLHEGNVRRIPFAFENDTAAELIAGAGGIISSTVDILKWLGVILNEGVDPVTGKTIIPQSAFIAITSAQSIVSGVSSGPGVSFLGYGLGWITASVYGHDLLQHGGGLQGFISLITLLPSDGIGIVSFINQVSSVPNGVATNWILLDVLNMLPTSSNSSTKSRLHSTEGLAQFSNVNVAFSDFEFTHGLQERQIVNRSYGIDFSQRTTLNTVTTDLPPDAYAGTYSNPGYGSFTFCSPSSNLSTTNEYCASTLSDFSKVFPASPPSEEQGLYATWARVWASHVRALPTTAGANSSVVQNRQTYIDQISANTFDFSFITLYPSGYGKNSTPFYDDSILIPATGIFDVVDGEVKGLGMFEDYSPPSIIKDGTLKEIAEIYFVKTG